jgi:hypothetical protein
MGARTHTHAHTTHLGKRNLGRCAENILALTATATAGAGAATITVRPSVTTGSVITTLLGTATAAAAVVVVACGSKWSASRQGGVGKITPRQLACCRHGQLCHGNKLRWHLHECKDRVHRVGATCALDT